MTVVVPGMTDDHRMIDVRPNRVMFIDDLNLQMFSSYSKESEGLFERAKHRDTDQLISLQNKSPVWNDGKQMIMNKSRLDHHIRRNSILCSQFSRSCYGTFSKKLSISLRR